VGAAQRRRRRRRTGAAPCPQGPARHADAGGSGVPAPPLHTNCVVNPRLILDYENQGGRAHEALL
ncbi:MAG: hypothetical protein ACK5TH_02970, partial [Prosthecobacter sp.]